MRLAHISTIEEANWFLESYLQKYNAKFAIPALDPSDAYKPEGWQPDTIKQPAATSALSTLFQSGCGCANLSTQPKS
jgi:hypothetical protein